CIGGIVGWWGGIWGGGTMAIIIGALYQWYFLTQQDGQTPGKRLVGIKVVSASGGKISDLDAVLRYVGYHIDSLILSLGWFWALFDRNRQCWHDKLARTYVIRVRSADQVGTVYVDPTSKKRKNEVI
ncbi:MAG TPA: RDD family protein, partial [Phototrophicaceae bacterium]|nr:RDD family protein [Phototrophicaceae bacterium]